jgi:hypothetical protein
MRRLFAVALFAGLLSCAGCFLAGVPETIAPAKAPIAVRTVPPVLPEHVTPVNGHQIAQALEEEMTREAQSSFLSPR